jgi:hypothetical protein
MTESSEETTPLADDKPESSDVMTVHSDWRTPFIIDLKVGAYKTTRMKGRDCSNEQDITTWLMMSYFDKMPMDL